MLRHEPMTGFSPGRWHLRCGLGGSCHAPCLLWPGLTTSIGFQPRPEVQVELWSCWVRDFDKNFSYYHWSSIHARTSHTVLFHEANFPHENISVALFSYLINPKQLVNEKYHHCKASETVTSSPREESEEVNLPPKPVPRRIPGAPNWVQLQGDQCTKENLFSWGDESNENIKQRTWSPWMGVAGHKSKSFWPTHFHLHIFQTNSSWIILELLFSISFSFLGGRGLILHKSSTYQYHHKSSTYIFPQRLCSKTCL